MPQDSKVVVIGYLAPRAEIDTIQHMRNGTIYWRNGKQVVFIDCSLSAHGLHVRCALRVDGDSAHPVTIDSDLGGNPQAYINTWENGQIVHYRCATTAEARARRIALEAT